MLFGLCKDIDLCSKNSNEVPETPSTTDPRAEYASFVARNVDLFQNLQMPNIKLCNLEASDVRYILHSTLLSDEKLSKVPVRFVLASRLLEWNRLMCYEELDKMPEDVHDVPYDATQEHLWNKTCVLSWRWSNSAKPSSLSPSFSPMFEAQFLQLQVLLKRAIRECQISYVWVDWCCVPQYSKSPMVEIARSKVFYMRARLMIVLPKFKSIPNTVIYVLLQQCVRVISKRNIKKKSDMDMTLRALSFLVDHRQMADMEYFGRVWTLCERLARCGRSEPLQQWLSLADWLGMVVDAVIHIPEDNAATDIYWSKLFPEEVCNRLTSLAAKLNRAIKTESVLGAGQEALAEELAALFVDAVNVWQTAKMNEVPDKDWLQRYLTQEAGTIYKASNAKDTVWAVYSYFIVKTRDVTSDSEWMAAIGDLITVFRIDLQKGWLWQLQQIVEKQEKAKVLCHQKKDFAAEILYRQALAMSKETLGRKHPDTVKLMSTLADCLGRQGKYADTERLHRRALAIRKEVLGRKHADTATSLNDLAHCLDSLGKPAEAEPLYRRALAIRKEALGCKHADTAQSLNNLAVCLLLQNKPAEAGPLHRRALAIREEALGRKHADTATSLNNLALCLRLQNKPAEAEPLYRRALAIRKEALGRKHADTVTALNNLALCLYYQNKPAEAEPLYRRALAIREEALGPKHADTAQSLNNLAVCLLLQNKPAEAEPLHRRALAIREQALGPMHADTAQSLNNLANCLHSLNKPAEAEPLHRRALAIREEALGPKHADTAQSLNNLANCLHSQNKPAEAEPLYRRALAIREEALGPKHADTAHSLNNLANCLHSQNKPAEAEPLHCRALAIREEALGPKHADTAQSLNNLAVCLRLQNKPAEAEPLYRRALAIREEALGPKHADTATSLNNLAKCLTNLGKGDEAKRLRSRAQGQRG